MKLKEIPVSIFHSIRLRYFNDKKSTKDSIDVVISLTSIPTRLDTLDIVIASLFDQSIRPKNIILWLNNDLKDKLPSRLTTLQNDTFVIRYCAGTSSYRKLLPSLKAYENSVIVTCDDDMIYPSHWLENLYSCHLKNKQCVISQVGRIIEWDKFKELKPYKLWPFVRYECTQPNLLPIGYGGVLYPVNTFNQQVFDEKLYTKLAPKADDLWFKAMASINNKIAYCASEKARPIPIMRSQQVSLNSTNIKSDGNRQQWSALCDHFPQLKDI